METKIRGILRRLRGRTFLTSLALILIAEALTIVLAWRWLDVSVNRWVDNKALEAMRISQEVATSDDWSSIDKAIKDEASASFKDYHKKVVQLTQHHFRGKQGWVYLVAIEHGKEYDIDPDDDSPTEMGNANEIELRAYSSRQPTYTQVPISGNGTYIAAYTPIVSNGKIVGLVATEFDSAPLADLQGIVRQAFWSIVPAILISLVTAYVLAGMFVEPMQVVRDVENARQRSLSQSQNGRLPWNLTDREGNVFESLADGLTDKQIGTRLVVSPETVKTHMKSIRKKSGLTERYELIFAAREWRAQKAAPAAPA